MYADLEQLEKIIVKSLSNLYKSLYLENMFLLKGLQIRMKHYCAFDLLKNRGLDMTTSVVLCLI